MTTKELTSKIIGCAIEVHKVLGPGLLESVYQECLAFELENAGLEIETEVIVPIYYKGIKLDRGYRIDILVEEEIVLELKTVDKLIDKHQAQVLTYLRLGGFNLGYLLNFNEVLMRKGIKRFIL